MGRVGQVGRRATRPPLVQTARRRVDKKRATLSSCPLSTAATSSCRRDGYVTLRRSKTGSQTHQIPTWADLSPTELMSGRSIGHGSTSPIRADGRRQSGHCNPRDLRYATTDNPTQLAGVGSRSSRRNPPEPPSLETRWWFPEQNLRRGHTSRWLQKHYVRSVIALDVFPHID